MERRHFLQYPLVVIPASGLVVTEPPKPKPYEFGLSEHQSAVRDVVQDNMHRANVSAIRRRSGEMRRLLHIYRDCGLTLGLQNQETKEHGDAFFREAKLALSDCLHSNLMEQFSVQWRRMVTIQIAGVQPMTGPVGLCFMDSHESVNHDHIDNRLIESVVDYTATLGGLARQYPGIAQPEIVTFSGYFAHPRHYLRKVSSSVVSLVLATPESLSGEIDKLFLRSMHVVAQSASWDIWGTLGSGTWVVANPINAGRIQRRLGLMPFVSEWCPVGSALIGIKRSEYDAPVYFLPYMAYAVSDAGNGKRLIASRFGGPLFPGVQKNLWKIRV